MKVPTWFAARREPRAPERWSVPDRDAANGLAAAGELRMVGTSLRMPERFIRTSIAAMVPVFGVVAAVFLFSGEGPDTSVGRWLWVAVIASTIPAGIIVARVDLTPMWWAQHSRPWGVNHLFVLYGDVGVSAMLFTFAEPEAALYCSSLFAILSAYAAHFCSPRVRNLHIVATTVVILALAVITWRTNELSTMALLGRVLTTITVVNGTVVLQSMFALGVRTSIRSTLLDAHQDALTLLWNRRGFTYWATATVKHSKGPIGMLIVDIDDYKSINDRYGHRVGDDVLQIAARRLEAAVGDHGVLARTGGDEFAVATELDLEGLLWLAETIRRGIHQAVDAVPVTASIGAAAGPRDAAAIRRMGPAEHIITIMLHSADTALYEAKQAGRDCVAYVDLVDAGSEAQVVLRE